LSRPTTDSIIGGRIRRMGPVACAPETPSPAAQAVHTDTTPIHSPLVIVPPPLPLLFPSCLFVASSDGRSRLLGAHGDCTRPQASSSVTTSPSTSVRRKSRPLKR